MATPVGATGSKVRFARDPGGTGRRGIADRLRYADFALPIWQVARLKLSCQG
jgi:hypothetical protein